MKNVIKATVIATSIAAVGVAQASPQDWSAVSNELGKYGINLTVDEIKTQVLGDDGFVINSQYNDVLKAQDAAQAQGQSFTDLAANLVKVQQALNVWDGDTVKVKDASNFLSDWDDWAAGLIDGRVTEILDTDVENYLDDIGTATGGVVTDIVDATITPDTNKLRKASVGLDLLVYVAGGEKDSDVKDFTGNESENSDNYTGRRITEFMTDLDSTLVADSTGDNIKTAFKGNVNIGSDYFENEDFVIGKNGSDYEITGLSTDFMSDHSITNKSAFKVELYDLGVEQNNTYAIYGRYTDKDDVAQTVQLSTWLAE